MVPTTKQLIDIEVHYQFKQQIRMKALSHAGYRADNLRFENGLAANAVKEWYQKRQVAEDLLQDPTQFTDGKAQQWASRSIVFLKNMNIQPMTQGEIDALPGGEVPEGKEYITTELTDADDVEVFLEKLVARNKTEELAITIYNEEADEVEF